MYGDLIVTSNENHLIKHGIVLLLVNIKLELTCKYVKIIFIFGRGQIKRQMKTKYI